MEETGKKMQKNVWKRSERKGTKQAAVAERFCD
jgi:hypothetical protein